MSDDTFSSSSAESLSAESGSTVSKGPGTLRAVAAFALRDAVNTSVRAARDVLFLRQRPFATPGRIVVHHVGNIGDVVTAIPAFVALRKRFPVASIVLVTSTGPRGLPGARDLVEGTPYFDRIVEYSLEDLRARGGSLRLLRIVRELRPDLLVMLPPSMVRARTLLRNLGFARATGARFVVGLEMQTAPMFLVEQARCIGRCPSEVERNLGLLSPLGVGSEPVRFQLAALSEADGREVDNLVGRLGLFVAVCPGGKQREHLWPVERFATVCRHIRAETGHEIVTVGSAGERAECDRLLTAVGGGANAAGRLSVRATAELTRRATLLLTNDTGPMHLAAAVGTPIAAIFSGRDFVGRWYPYGNGHEIFRARDVCETCLFSPKMTDHCVREIRAEDVTAGCLRILRRPPHPVATEA
jgi:heptosyltransferase-3